jgi:hypothetical protein
MSPAYHPHFLRSKTKRPSTKINIATFAPFRHHRARVKVVRQLRKAWLPSAGKNETRRRFEKKGTAL